MWRSTVRAFVCSQKSAPGDAAAAKIPGTYQAARNLTASSGEVSRQNFNEYAAANGLNSGTGAQANLSMNNRLLSDLSGINSAQAQALSDIENQRLKAQASYNNAIAEAKAEGNLARARALYEEMVRVDESMVSTALNQAELNYRDKAFNYGVGQDDQSAALEKAQTLAAYGDFSGYKALGYTDAEIAAMKSYWDKVSGR